MNARWVLWAIMAASCSSPSVAVSPVAGPQPLRGRLTREGRSVDLASAGLPVHGTRCREAASAPWVKLVVGTWDEGAGVSSDPVLELSADLTRVRAGQRITPFTQSAHENGAF